MEYAVKCPHCGKEISLWDIALHLEDCKKKKDNEKNNEKVFEMQD